MSVSEASSTAAPRHHRSVRDISKYTEERRLGIVKVYLWRLLIIAVVLTSWQFLPQIHGLRHISTVFNPFFVSSPTRVAREMWTLTATNGPQAVWPYLFLTLKTSLIGTGIGILAGGLLGLVLSNDRRVRKILNPFINFANAAPKIAVIPVILVIFGATVTSPVIVGSMTAFFAVFFNAYAGGRGVAPEMVQNAYLLGATPITAMLRIRGMYVVLWTFAALPNAISHSLLGVVTAEVLGGARGMGRLIEIALGTVNATSTFAVLVILAVSGAALVGAAEVFRRSVLHWWPGED